MAGYTEDEKYMQRCIDLAIQGKGLVAPNPMVGALLVNNHAIVGEGFHQGFGEAHAEANAINNVTSPDLLKKAVLYVNLEPCSHQGKTPPCANLIISMGIPKIVIGTPDPNKLVDGSGIALLREKGINVVTGILENECKALNKRFFTWHLYNRPYIILKWARSADGFIDFDRPADAPVGPNWITSQTARILVHKWRSEEQAILVGTNTVIKDNPRLNIRDWAGKNPLRVIIDRELKLGSHYNVFDNTQKTLVFTQKEPAGSGPGPREFPEKTVVPETGNTERSYASIVFDDTAELQMLECLYRQNIQSIIIEGGAYTLNRFIEKGLWDEARIFTGPVLFRRGIRSPEITGNSFTTREIGNSQLQVIYNR